ncbi:MAG: transporter [Bacteroidota bacterium]
MASISKETQIPVFKHFKVYLTRLIKTFTISLSFIAFSPAQESQADELAKKLQNPVASLISIPVQGNFDFGVGPSEGFRMTTNIQPVIPISISENWNLIGRIVLPVVYQNDTFGDSNSQFGLSDAIISGFFSPKEPTSGGIIWGAGPAILAPIATDDLLGTEKLGIGPTAVILKQIGQFTVGALANHIWSIAGDDSRSDVNNTFLQPFVAKNFKGGYALTLNTEFTQNWELDGSSGFLHLVGSKVMTFGKQITQIFIGPRVPYGNANTTEWGFRAGITLLYPKN